MIIGKTAIIPHLVQAIQEQQTIIENLENKIETIENDCCGKTDKNLKSGTSDIEDLETELSKLYQNNPNPFSTSTQINFSISNATQTAMICIYNMNGTQLKCYHITERNSGSITIHSNELKAGMYLYALITDGKEVNTKKMILTE